MNRVSRLLAAAACGVVLLQPPALLGSASPAGTDRPELAYLEQVNQWRPPADPQLLFLLMAQFANAGRHVDGIAFFEGLRKRFDAQLSNAQKAQYLVAIASLRAGHANDVFLLERIGWVRDTVALLDEAKRLTGGQMYLARWMSGIVRAQLPGFFGERDTALADLDWCVEHVDRAPHPGWLREVYFQRAAVQRERGNPSAAQRDLARSGYDRIDKPTLFTTPFSSDPLRGHAFSARSIREVVPGTVYTVSGFDFTEYHFVVSADRRELISIDAGSSADAAREAHLALRAQVPALPPLGTVLVTHAHWDHVGGQRYFRGLSPAVRFIGRSNYAAELARDAVADPAVMQRFFGQRFKLDDALAYRPDVRIDHATELTIGGTRFELLPTRGGETDDAMLIRLPDHGVLFTGDILMPYFGAPFVEEGSVDGMLEAIDQVSALKPRILLHGHEPLTRLFTSSEMLAELRGQLAWLRDAVLREISAGAPRSAIHRSNLIPPTLSQSASNVHLAYLVMREHLIDRLFDQHSGYWQNGLEGLDSVSDADRGAALVDYLGLSESQLASAAERMVADGKHELAASILRSVQTRFTGSARLQAVRRLAYLKLMEKTQEFDPFKFILYAREIDQRTPRIAAPESIDTHASR